jgi:hypothetical protein
MRALALFVAALMACTLVHAQANEGLTETMHTVRLSRGGELRVVVSQRTGTQPNIAVLLFAGYPGILRIEEAPQGFRHELGGNFLIRARRFLNTDRLFTVMVDCPVDQWHSCDDLYRASPQHAADITDVIADVKGRLGAQQVYLVGTSYGTVSTSLLARALAGRIEGAVHTATFTDPRAGRMAHGAPLRDFDWSKQPAAPQLFVHHRDDPCDVTRHASIEKRRNGIPLITVEGAVEPRGEPCLARTQHGFVGRERVVMQAIGAWITERAVPGTVGERN